MSHLTESTFAAVQIEAGDTVNLTDMVTRTDGAPVSAPVWLEISAVSRRGKYRSKDGNDYFDHIVLRTLAGATPEEIKEKHRFKLASDVQVLVRRALHGEVPAEPAAEVPEVPAEPAAEVHHDGDLQVGDIVFKGKGCARWRVEIVHNGQAAVAKETTKPGGKLGPLRPFSAYSLQERAAAPAAAAEVGPWSPTVPAPGTEITA